jgi:glycosyltransferase involved in cell wall biosynthesis
MWMPSLDHPPAMLRSSPLITCATSAKTTTGWRWFEADYAGRITWNFHDAAPQNALERQITHPDLALTRSCWHAAREGAAMLISHGPGTTFRCAAFRRTIRKRCPHVAWTFNFTCLPQGLHRRMMAAAFTDVDRFVVFSTMERTLYSEAFEIPAEKFEVVLWSVAEPTVDQPDAPLEPGDYICAVGGNSRDYPALMEAMKGLPDIPLVAVMRPENVVGLSIPPNVRVRLNIPFGHANNIIKYSRFMVLPLLGSETPCGHVTLVNAMYLKKAFLVTDSTGVADYVREDENCLTFEAGSVDALAGRIRELWDDSKRCLRLGVGGSRFAEANCSENTMRQLLDRVLTDFGLLA